MEQEEKTIRRYYVELKPPANVDSDPPYALQSSWFDTKEEAIQWANNIYYKDYNYVGAMWLMFADWCTDEDGDEYYEDIESEKRLICRKKISYNPDINEDSWYVRITPPSYVNARIGHILSSVWFKKKSQAIKWAENIDYLNHDLVGRVELMHTIWVEGEDGERHTESIPEKVLRTK